MDELWWVAYGNSFSGRYTSREEAQAVVDSEVHKYEDRGVFVEVEAYDKLVEEVRVLRERLEAGISLAGEENK